MDATRQFRFSVYCPIDSDGNIEVDIQLSLEDAWAYYIETGCTLFMACDASMENNSCVLDMEDLTPTEEADIYKALKGR